MNRTRRGALFPNVAKGLAYLWGYRLLCSPLVVLASATVRSVALWRSHWAKLLERVLDGSMMCQIRWK